VPRADEPGVTLVPIAPVRARLALVIESRRAPALKQSGAWTSVSCPWHWYCFDLRTGESRTAAGHQLRKYPVLSQGGRLFARLPGESRGRAWLRPLRLLQLQGSARK
jgi:hypothetical protein